MGGYFTYRLFRDVSLEHLKSKVEANLALYESHSLGAQVKVTGFQGEGCSALFMGSPLHEAAILRPVGFQFGCVWMDVRYQDGDSWDVSVFEDTQHLVTHSVNPWAYESRVQYDQDRIDYRMNRVCEQWPSQGEILRPYLLLWRVPPTKLGRKRLVPRQGKAYETDQYCYGDAYQIHDFIRCFGIHEQSINVEISRPDRMDADR